MTSPRMRAGDSDRQTAVDRLTTHFTDGRLDPNEYDSRVQRAYAAAYLDEFSVLFEDLPEGQARGGSGWSGPPWHDRPATNAAAGGSGWGAMGAGWGGPGRRPGLPPGGPWGVRSPLRRPPTILAIVAAVIGVMVVSAVIAGLFFVGFPLFWIGLFVFMFARGGSHGRWSHHNGGGRSGRGGC